MSNWLFHVQSGSPPRTLKLFIYNEGETKLSVVSHTSLHEAKILNKGKLVLHLEK